MWWRELRSKRDLRRGEELGSEREFISYKRAKK
jgi:hypothetical protein